MDLNLKKLTIHKIIIILILQTLLKYVLKGWSRELTNLTWGKLDVYTIINLWDIVIDLE